MKAKYEEIIDNTKYRIVYESYLYKLVQSKIRFIEQNKTVTYFCTKLIIMAMTNINTYKLVVQDYKVLVYERQYKSFIYKFKNLAKRIAFYLKEKKLQAFCEEFNITESQINDIMKTIKNEEPIMKYLDLASIVEPIPEKKIEEKRIPEKKEVVQLKEIADTSPTPRKAPIKKLPDKMQRDLAERIIEFVEKNCLVEVKFVKPDGKIVKVKGVDFVSKERAKI